MVAVTTPVVFAETTFTSATLLVASSEVTPIEAKPEIPSESKVVFTSVASPPLKSPKSVDEVTVIVSVVSPSRTVRSSV